MANSHTFIRLILISIFSCVLAVPAFAQATRTWVSGVGDDANPCSRTAPCKTFAGAISKTAAKGEINALDPGGFGAVTITKSITIDGGGFISGVLVSGTNGIVINAGSSDSITLRNLDINGVTTGLNGIHFLAGGNLIVEKVKIYGFSNTGLGGINIAPTASSGMVDVTIIDSLINDNNTRAIALTPTGTMVVNATIDRVTMANNNRGVHATDGTNVTIKNSTLSNNTFYGISAVGSLRDTTVSIDDATIAFNGTSGIHVVGTYVDVNLSNSTVTSNPVAFTSSSGGTINSFGNNMLHGNTSGLGVTPIPANLQ